MAERGTATAGTVAGAKERELARVSSDDSPDNLLTTTLTPAPPVLATVPVRKTFALGDPVLGEAYDILRANLAFLSHDHAMQVFTVSSFNVSFV